MGKNNWYSTILVRTEAGKTKIALEGLKKLCKELNPAFPFSYKFSDEEYANLYKSDEVIGRSSVIFAGLAIFISCLGLLGLSIFTASQRVREIGVRKVLGASVASLFTLLSKEFLVLVGIGICHCRSARLVGHGSTGSRISPTARRFPGGYSEFPVCWLC